MKLSTTRVLVATGLLAVVGGHHSCTKKRTQTAAIKSQSVSLPEQILNYSTGASVDGKVGKDPSLLASFRVDDKDYTIDKGMINFNINISDASDFFEKNQVELLLTLTRTDSAGSSSVVTSGPVKSGQWNFSAQANTLGSQGDVFTLKVDGLSPSMENMDVYIYASVQLNTPPTVNDNLSQSDWPSWSYSGSTMATASDFVIGDESKSPPAPFALALPNESLWSVELSLSPSRASPQWSTGNDSTDPCEGTTLSGEATVGYKLKGTASQQKILLSDAFSNRSSKAGAGLGCSIGANESFESDKDTLTLVANLKGFLPNEHFVSSYVNVSTSVRAGAPPLGMVDAKVSAPNTWETTELSGKYLGQPIGAKVKATSLEGLRVVANASIFYPSNVKEVRDANFQDADAQKLKAWLVGPDGVKTELPFSWGDRTSVSFEEVQVTQVPPGGEQEYRLEFDFSALPKGVYLNVSMTTEKLFEVLPNLEQGLLTTYADAQRTDGSQDEFMSRISSYSSTGLMFDPPVKETYENADPSEGKPLPRTTMIAYMEEVRNDFHMATRSRIKKTELNSVDRSTIEACLGNTAPHWSDITLHYYCLHGYLRSCYTEGIRSTAGLMQQAKADVDAMGISDPKTYQAQLGCKVPANTSGTGPVLLHNIRDYVFEKCFVAPSVDLTATTPSLPGCDKLGITEAPAYAPINSDREAFSWLRNGKGKIPRDAMFRYMMDAPTFAFDSRSQQDVINATWRVTGLSEACRQDGSKCSAAEKAECNSKRPVRAIDPTDGTHCSANKQHNPPLEPAGR
jgi:hypothetical protein